jgi:hypothetical protein
VLPEQFIGAWRRRSIAFDGGEPTEPARVLWLQAGDAFADLRVPTAGDARVEAFAGTTAWDPPRLTWTHTVDWHGAFADFDCGEIAWRDALMIERGHCEVDGRPSVYEEVWERIDDGRDRAVLLAPGAVMVRVGRYCVAMRDRRPDGGGFDVRSARLVGDSWVDVDACGDAASLPVAYATTGDWEVAELSGASVPR